MLSKVDAPPQVRFDVGELIFWVESQPNANLRGVEITLVNAISRLAITMTESSLKSRKEVLISLSVDRTPELKLVVGSGSSRSRRININPIGRSATKYDESAMVGITQIQVEPEPSNSLPVSTVTIRHK